MDRRRFLKGSAAVPSLLRTNVLAQQGATASVALPPAGADGWVSLLNGRDFSGWYSVLQHSGRGAAERKGIIAMEDDPGERVGR